MRISSEEKARRKALLKSHYDAENDHDMDAIMATFSKDCEMLYNRTQFPNTQSIKVAHQILGFSGNGGAFENVDNQIDAEHFTEQEIVVEGRLCAKHVGEFRGFEATGRDVELPFVAFYHFDKKGELISERIIMNLETLHPHAQNQAGA